VYLEKEGALGYFLHVKIARSGAFVFLFFLAFFSCHQKKSSPQNVLLITMDTTRFDYFNYVIEHSPQRFPLTQLRAVVNGGAQFTQAVTVINCTNPSHLSILTSVYPSQHGVHTNTQRFESNVPTLAEMLTKSGFVTAAGISAYHLGNPKLNILRGFFDHAVPQGAFRANEMTDLAISWLTRANRDKYFLWVHYFDPHAIYDPPPQYIGQSDSSIPEADRRNSEDDGKVRVLDRDPFFQRTGFGKLWENWIGKEYTLKNVKIRYMGEILFMCDEINRLLEFLKKSKYGQNTLVVLVADHGESLGEHNIYFDHMGLYEQQVRVPLIFYYPQQIASSKISQQVRTIDILPTILQLLQLSIPSGISGSSLMPLIKSGKATNWVEHAMIENTDLTQVSYRDPKWKLIMPVKEDRVLTNGEELFDLSGDRAESQNALSNHQQISSELKKELQQYLQHAKTSSHPALTNEELEKLRSLGYTN